MYFLHISPQNQKVFQYFQVLNLGGKKNVEARGKEALQL